jgi:hypothetical protein
MSVARLIALLFFVILGGGGFVMFVRSLYRRHVLSQDGSNPMLGVGAFGLGGLVFLLLWYGFAFAEPPGDFMRALRAGDDARAYGLLSVELQEQLGGPAGFSEWTDAFQVQRWFFASACSSSGYARSDGTGRFVDGERFSVSFHLRREEGDWVIQGIEYWESSRLYRAGASSGLDCSE